MAFLGKELTPTAVLECDPTVSPKKSTIRLDAPSARLGISIKVLDELTKTLNLIILLTVFLFI